MTELINRFSYANLRNEAHVQLHENFISLAGSHNLEELGIKSLYDRYMPLFEQEKATLDVISKSGFTDDILALDQERDHLYRGFFDAVKSSLNHYDEAKQKAAEKINFILTRYGNIASRPLDQETAAIDDLNRELRETRNFEFLSALGLEGWLEHLVAANSSFDKMMMARYKETAEKPTVNMRSARSAVDKVFRAILDVVEAFAIGNGTGKYSAFIAELNAIMERYANILSQSKGARAKKEAPAGEIIA